MPPPLYPTRTRSFTSTTLHLARSDDDTRDIQLASDLEALRDYVRKNPDYQRTPLPPATEPVLDLEDVRLAPARTEEQRFDIIPIHGANALMGDGLKVMWAERAPQEAHDLLKEPDVTVTNQSDKDVQLEKLLKLDEQVRIFWIDKIRRETQRSRAALVSLRRTTTASPLESVTRVVCRPLG